MFFLKDRPCHMRTVWGHTFEWTTEHQTKDQMRPLTFTYDVLASDCLDRLDERSLLSTKFPFRGMKEGSLGVPPNDSSRVAHPRRDLYTLLEQHHASDAKLEELWTQVHTVPPWVDWEQIRRGQDVLYRYGGPSVVSLTFQSLVGGMAGWRVVETLARTGGFGVKVAKHRLLETFQHILQVTKDLDSVRPGGDGFVSSIRVRLLHASVRRRIMSLARKKPGYFDVAEWGVPLNDLDCIGTVLSFSAALIWLGLPRQGIYLREQEIVDYHALWRWVGYLLGTPTDPWLADWQQSKVMLENLIVAELVPSETSRVLANNVLTGLSCQPPTYASRDFLCAEAHWLNGTELSLALGIPEPRQWHKALVAAQCLYFMCTCYLYRTVPSWDRQRIERVRKLFYRMTVQDKTVGLGQENIFDFKFVPQLDLTTSPGGSEDLGPGKRINSSEHTNLSALVLMALLAGLVVWLGARYAARF